jgi:hypothetical protein
MSPFFATTPIFAKLPSLTLPITQDNLMERSFIQRILKMETVAEQRQHVRTELSWPVSVWLPEANRFFNGRSANISKTGVLVSLPMATPVRPGNIVEINFPRSTALAKEKGSFARIKSGKVVRVERRRILKDASIGVAINFECEFDQE